MQLDPIETSTVDDTATNAALRVMNDAAARSSLPSTPAARDDSSGERAEEAELRDGPRPRSRRREQKVLIDRKRAELLDQLIRALDVIVFTELAAVYYLEFVSSSINAWV